MKKYICLFLVLLLVLSISCSCSNPNTSNKNENPVDNGNTDEQNNQSESDITISYAHMETENEIINLKTYSNDVEQTDGNFANGGKVSVNEKGITLDKISEKDKLIFDLKLINKSNVDIKYKPYIILPYDNDLIDALKITINGANYDEFANRQWQFAKFDSKIKELETLTISIEMPEMEESLFFSNDTGFIEIQTKVVQGNLNVYNDVKVTPENITSIDFTQDETQYEFYGKFTNPLIKAIGAENKKQIYDGSNAQIEGQIKFYFQPHVSDLYEIIENDRAIQRSGKYTVRNFKYMTDSISVIAKNTKIIIENNVTCAIDIAAPNCDIEILNNTINALSAKHKRFDNGMSTYGFYYYNAINYNCIFNGNTVSNTLGHAVVFHGNFGVLNNYNWNNVDSFKINNRLESFKNNNINAASDKACIKYWDDSSYCANQAYNNEKHFWYNAKLDSPEEDLIVFIKNQYNSFNLSNNNSYIFSFYDVLTNDALSENI